MDNNNLPLVSVCTPTFNRRPFIKTMFQCFNNQTYPKDKIEWIIVDDGTDKIKDLVVESGIEQIRYFELEEKLMLGAKRNYMHKQCRGDIIVYMDDDDYYPPERITHSVEKLLSKPEALCAGASEIYIYFKHISKMIQCGPYGDSHATAGTFAFKKELLDITSYDDGAALAEEKAFLKEYTIPFVQLDPLKTILVFSHNHNTYDKRKMFDTAHPKFFKESDKTVDMFIQHDYEVGIKKYFMVDIEEALSNYEPGLPNMKPDVLKQISEIEKNREKMIAEMMEKQKNAPIMLSQPGQEPRQLNNLEIRNMITNLQAINGKLQKEKEELYKQKEELYKQNFKLQNDILDITIKYDQLQQKVKSDTSLNITDIHNEPDIPYSNVNVNKETKLKPDIEVDISDI